MTVEERFWSKVDRGVGPNFDAGRCWLWTGGVNGNGYGNFWWNGKTVEAHRASWLMTNGEIPAGQCVCHRCDNPICVNSAHLFLGDGKDNIRDAISKGRFPQNFAGMKGEKHYMVKITEQDALEIRRLGAEGKLPLTHIAARFGISRRQVSRIIKGQRWKHLKSSAETT